jgi:hypothetical protein
MTASASAAASVWKLGAKGGDLSAERVEIVPQLRHLTRQVWRGSRLGLSRGFALAVV